MHIAGVFFRVIVLHICQVHGLWMKHGGNFFIFQPFSLLCRFAYSFILWYSSTYFLNIPIFALYGILGLCKRIRCTFLFQLFCKFSYSLVLYRSMLLKVFVRYVWWQWTQTAPTDRSHHTRTRGRASFLTVLGWLWDVMYRFTFIPTKFIFIWYAI